MRLLLDTHVLLWWHDEPARLTETAYDAINDLGNDVFISAVNGWEIDIIDPARQADAFQAVVYYIPGGRAGDEQFPEPVCHYGACLCPGQLSPAPQASLDRLLIAQAHQEGLTLVTHDPKLSPYSVSLLW